MARDGDPGRWQRRTASVRDRDRGRAAVARAARRVPAEAALARAGRDLRRRRGGSRRRVADVRLGVGRDPQRPPHGPGSPRGRLAGRIGGAAAGAGRGEGSPRARRRADSGGLREAAETEGADGLDLHLRRHDDRAARAGRAAHRRRPGRRRDRLGREIHLRARGMGSPAARRVHAQHRHPGRDLDRLRRPAPGRRDRRHDRVEPRALRAAAVPRRGGDGAGRVHDQRRSTAGRR